MASSHTLRTELTRTRTLMLNLRVWNN